MKRTFKKSLALLLTLCMVLGMFPAMTLPALAATDYNIMIEGESVTSDNLSGTGWVYDPAANTLTLSGTNTLNGDVRGFGLGAAINISRDLIIELAEGANITANGAVYTAQESAASYGIQCMLNYKLTIQGSGSLIARGADVTQAETMTSGGISCGDMVFNGTGTLTAIGGNATVTGNEENSVALSAGICANYAHSTTVTVNSGTVIATGGTASATAGAPTSSYGTNCALTVNGGTVKLSGNDGALAAAPTLTGYTDVGVKAGETASEAEAAGFLNPPTTQSFASKYVWIGQGPAELAPTAALSALTVTGTDVPAMHPVFDPTISSYSVTVPNGTTSVTIDATADTGSAIDAVNSDLGEKTLTVGANTFTVVATKGDQTLNYTVTVTREAAPIVVGENDLRLASFSLTPYGGGNYAREGVIDHDNNTITVDLAAFEKAQELLVSFVPVQAGATVTYRDGAAEITTSGTTRVTFGETVPTVTVAYGGQNKIYTLTVTENGAAVQNYGLGVKTATDGHYNAGETVTYELYATAPNSATTTAMDIGSFQFTMSYDQNLTYEGFTPAFEAEAKETNSGTAGTLKLGYVAQAAVPVPFKTTAGSGYVKLGDVTFTVDAGIPETTTALTDAELSAVEVTPKGYDKNNGVVTIATDTDTVSLHNNIVTFNNNHTTGIAANTKAYVKYGQAGLYTSNAYTTPFTVPTPTADMGYRLVNGQLWSVATVAEPPVVTGYANAAALQAAVLTGETQTNNLTATPNVLWGVMVSFLSADEDKGTLWGNTGVYCDEGSLLEEPGYTVYDGYEFAGWTLDKDTSPIVYLDLTTYRVPGVDVEPDGEMNVYGVFTDADYSFFIRDEDDNHVTETITGGVEEDGNWNKIVHGTDITFTLSQTQAEAAAHFITAVEYQVGEGDWKPATYADGTYTIPGGDIISDVALKITTMHYHTLSYAKGDGVVDTSFNYLKITSAVGVSPVTYEQENDVNKTFTAAEIYVKDNEAGLYADKACTERIELVSPETVEDEATSRYRSTTNASDTEYAWVSGDNHYHTAPTAVGDLNAISETAFTADAELTSRAIQQFKVNFAIGAISENVYGANFGTRDEALVRETSEWYDVDTVLTTTYDGQTYTGNVPQTFLEAGYDGGVWAPALAAVTESASYTFTVAHGQYAITFNNTNEVDYTDHVSVTVSTGAGNTETGTITHTAEGGDVKFKAAGIVKDGDGETSFVMTGLSATIGGADYPLTPDVDGFYVIPGEDITGAVVITPTAVEYVKVTFAGDEGAQNATGTAYARKDVAGLYTDTSFDTTFTFPTPTAKTNYRLHDAGIAAQYWTTGGGQDPSYVNAESISSAELTGNATYTAATVKTITISFNAPVNGKLNDGTAAPASITFDEGTTLGALADPAFPTATPEQGYGYTGWTYLPGLAGSLETPIEVGKDAVAATTLAWLETGSYTFTAVFTELSFKWLTPILENAAIDASYPTGVDFGGAGTEDDTVTYGTPITFKLTADANHAIRVDGVSYRVGDEVNWVKMTADNGCYNAQTGVYTIPGNFILGDVQINVSAEAYVTITFQAGTGNTLTTTTAVAKYNEATLYTDLTEFISGKSTFTVPVPVAAAGYRLMKDTAGGEELWATNETPTARNLTSTAVSGTTMFTANTTLTARSQKTWDVTYVVATNPVDPNSKGTLTLGDKTAQSTITVTVDDQYFLTDADIPTTNPNSGYQFNNWTYGESGTATSLVNQQITANVTYTANFAHGVYAISLAGDQTATFAPGTGVTTVAGEPVTYAVTHATDAGFTITHKDGKRVTGLSYTIGGGEAVILTPTGTGYYDYDGAYTILGADITGNVVVTVQSTDTHTVTFAPGASGRLTGTTSFVIDHNGTLADKITGVGEHPIVDAVVPTGETAYNFKEWRLGNATTGTVMTEAQILAATVTEDVTYYAVFDSPGRSITEMHSVVELYTAGYTKNQNNALYNQDVEFQARTCVVSIRYMVQNPNLTEDQENNYGWPAYYTELEPDENGVYTIPGNMITGNIRIDGTYLGGGTEDPGIDYSVEFIKRDEYKAIVAETFGKKIFVLNGAVAGNTYKLANGTELYWSSRYNAAVCWVPDTATAQSVMVGMTMTAGTAATAIVYGGDVNNSGGVTAADAMIINDCLHDQRLVATSAMQLFMCDVEGTGTGAYTGNNGWKYVSASDVTWTLNKAVNP